MPYTLQFEELDENGEVIKPDTQPSDSLADLELTDLELIPGMTIHTGPSGDLLNDPITDPRTGVYHGVRWNEDVQATDEELKEAGIVDETATGPVTMQLGLRIYEIPAQLYPISSNIPMPEMTEAEMLEFSQLSTQWNTYVSYRKRGLATHDGAVHPYFSIQTVTELLDRIAELLDVVVPSRLI